MADKLKMYVLAVGQGSCGLTAHYDSAGKLIQLDLCDCGSDGYISQEALQDQMQIIHGLMKERADVHRGNANLYLDNVIISHKDNDHLSLLTNTYFLNDLQAAPEADKKTWSGQRVRTRIVPLFPNRELVGEPDDEFLILRASYLGEPEKGNCKTASMEYHYSNLESKEVLQFTLLYKQYYCIPEAAHPTLKKPLCYSSALNPDRDPALSDYDYLSFRHIVDFSTEGKAVSWCLSGFAEQLDVSLYFFLTVEQGESICVDFRYRTTFSGLSKELTLPSTPGAICSLDKLYEYTQEVLAWLYKEKIFELFPEKDLTVLQQKLSEIGGLCERSFQQMQELLTPRQSMLYEKDAGFALEYLFGPDGLAAPHDGTTMAIGNLYVGGIGLEGNTKISKNVYQQLDPFCGHISKIQDLSEKTTGVFLMQIPPVYAFKVPCKVPKKVSNERNALPMADPLHSLDKFDLIRVKPKENDCSTMYIASDRDGCRAIFPGDATGITMKYFLDAFPKNIPLSDTWLAAPHHGSWETCKNAPRLSKDSPLEDYLTRLSPRLLFISAGYQNQHCHPRSEFLDVASRLMTDTVSQHLYYYFDFKTGKWEMRETQKGIYTNVSQLDDNYPYYFNLTIETGQTEPKRDGPLMTPEKSPYIAGLCPSHWNAFPFLFDEPSAVDAFAL